MKVLNLYAGIGGNRKLWTDVEVTAVELNPKIAAIYSDFFPDDKVVVGDAHQYLLQHFEEFDFIWSSPPCPTHSILNTAYSTTKGWKNTVDYPDMALYQEVILLKHFFKGRKYCVENVISYYNPLIPAQKVHKHYFWANFYIPKFTSQSQHFDNLNSLYRIKDMNLTNYSISNKRQIMRNCIVPKLGLHVLEASKKDVQPEFFTNEKYK